MQAQDVTPEAVAALIDRQANGLIHAIMVESLKVRAPYCGLANALLMLLSRRSYRQHASREQWPAFEATARAWRPVSLTASVPLCQRQ